MGPLLLSLDQFCLQLLPFGLLGFQQCRELLVGGVGCCQLLLEVSLTGQQRQHVVVVGGQPVNDLLALGQLGVFFGAFLLVQDELIVYLGELTEI